MVKALGLDEARRIMDEVNSKAPVRLYRELDKTPLSREEKETLRNITACKSMKEAASLLGFGKSVSRVYVKITQLAIRHLCNSKI